MKNTVAGVGYMGLSLANRFDLVLADGEENVYTRVILGEIN